MSKPRFIIFLIIIYLSGCANKNEEIQSSSPIEQSNSQDSFFPVTSYIRGQVLLIDSLPITPLQIISIKGKTDSTWRTKEILKQFLAPFLTAEISETNLTKYFKETRFNDQTIDAITFTYEPKAKLPDSISLRRWDVYVDPEKEVVTKIYIVKHLKENGQNITQQLTWQPGKLAKISTILNKPDGSLELLKEEQFIWNF